MIVGDALDMRAVQRAHRRADLAVEALMRACDGLIMGPALDENDVAAVCAALAVRVSEDRLEEAAGRMRELARLGRPGHARAPTAPSASTRRGAR